MPRDVRFVACAVFSAGALLWMALSVAAAPAQTPAAIEPVAAEPAERVYAHADPYMNKSLFELKTIVPALEGVKGNPSQGQLEPILSRTGQVIQGQAPRMPDLTARESVSQVQFAAPHLSQNGEQDGVTLMGGRGRGPQQSLVQYTMDEKQLEQTLHSRLLTGSAWRDFDYLMLSRPSPGGSPMLEESRTDPKSPNGAPAKMEKKPLHGIGFGSLWLLFLPDNLLQSSHRLLGEQKMYGRATYVVAFAQLPDRVKVPGEITLLGKAYPLLYQGIAWVDQSTFRIVRLRTDLLAPLPSLGVQRLTSDLRFSEVRIPELDLPLWLPNEVEVAWQQGDQLFGEMHLYAKYRLFHATAKIVPPA
ncbi:MAG TPA: hypothetical protein VGR96_18025 [Acidobacteriaceae bacterium]|nr:hypothetical protein [Acidobacteriaceae bacterium]